MPTESPEGTSGLCTAAEGVRLSHDGGQLVELAQRGCRDAGGDTCRGALRQGNRGGRRRGVALCYRCSLSGSLGGGAARRKPHQSWLRGHLNGLELSTPSQQFLPEHQQPSQQHRRCPQRQLRQEHQPGREPQMRSRRRLSSSRAGASAEASAEAASVEVSCSGSRSESSRNAGRGRLFSLLCCRLFCGFLNGLGTIQSEGLSNHGAATFWSSIAITSSAGASSATAAGASSSASSFF